MYLVSGPDISEVSRDFSECSSAVRSFVYYSSNCNPADCFQIFFLFPTSFQATRHIGGVATLSHLRLFRNSHQLGHHLVSFFQIFFLFRMCACVLVCIVCGMCSLTIECVLLLQNVFSCIVCVYRVCVCVCACAYVCACVRACVDVCMEGGECQCVRKPSLLNPEP